MSDTHYETLGVAPDASRDEIRDAYRARVSELDPESWKGEASARREQAAAVNRAWNVLSDPFQKERYDSGIDDSIAGVDDVEVVDDGSGADGRDAKPTRAANARGGVVQTKTTPTGLTIAPTRARINALSVDVLVILVIVFGLNFIAGQLFANPAAQVKIKDEIVRTVELEDRSFGAVRDEIRPQEQRKWNRDHSEKDDVQLKGVKVDEVQVVPGNITLLFQLATFVLALLYTAIPTVRTGQTLGKRIFKTRLVSVDGSPVGWSQSLLHYGVPIAIAIALALLGAVVAIGMVVWSVWDKRGQGFDDKIAKTFVVEA